MFRPASFLLPLRVLAAALVLGLALNLGACFSSRNPDDHCADVSEYQEQRTVGSIVVPDDLTAPAGTASYSVPPATAVAAAANAGDGPVPGAACLARPPPYFRVDQGPVPAPR